MWILVIFFVTNLSFSTSVLFPKEEVDPITQYWSEEWWVPVTDDQLSTKEEYQQQDNPPPQRD